MASWLHLPSPQCNHNPQFYVNHSPCFIFYVCLDLSFHEWLPLECSQDPWDRNCFGFLVRQYLPKERRKHLYLLLAFQPLRPSASLSFLICLKKKGDKLLCLGLESYIFLFLDPRNYDFLLQNAGGGEKKSWIEAASARCVHWVLLFFSARHWGASSSAWADGRVMQLPLKRGKQPNGWGVNPLRGQCFRFLLAALNVVSTSYRIKISLDALQS